MEQASIEWTKVAQPRTDISPMLQMDWFHFRATLVGHNIYVHSGHGRTDCNPLELYICDTTTFDWNMITLGGDVPETINGNSEVLVNDTLVSIGIGSASAAFRWNMAMPSMFEVSLVDLNTMQWERRKIYGDVYKPREYHVAAFDEITGNILLNFMDASKQAQVTCTLNVFSWEMKDIRAKGPSPSPRLYHSSCLLESQRKWIIVGGQAQTNNRNLLGDIYVLDLQNSVVPSWSRSEALTAIVGGVRACSLVGFGSSVLIFGGVRSSSEGVILYDTKSTRVHDSVVSTIGLDSFLLVFHQMVVCPNNTLVMLASQARRGRDRCFQGRVQINSHSLS